MPTGYTEPVQNGSVTELKDFVLQCARAFGALVSMREESFDAPIPDEIKPNISYYDERIQEEQRRLYELTRMDDEAKDREAYAAWEKRRSSILEMNKERGESLRRYSRMLEKVRRWKPPTADHEELKNFMIEQLESSIQWDCKMMKVPKQYDSDEWWQSEIESLQRSIKHNIEARKDEMQRAKERTAWLRELRQSLDR